jgi:hypothetical protein
VWGGGGGFVMSSISMVGLGAASGTIGVLVFGAMMAGMLQLSALSAVFGGLAVVFVVAGAFALIGRSL